MKFIIAKKIEMTEIWQGDQVLAVTKVQAGPCRIAQIKTKDKDGYEAVQLSFGERKVKNIRKPQLGHLRKAGIDTTGKTSARTLREFRLEALPEGISAGAYIKAETFETGDAIQVTGVSKGKGFQGVVRRHGFKGTDEQHGNKDQSRMPGSVGATGPAHVFKGTRMAGRMGNDQVTIKSLEVVKVDLENDILYIKGGVPGARNSLVFISGPGELKLSDTSVEEIVEETPVVEEAKPEAEVKAEAEAPVETKAAASAETPEAVEKEVVEAKEKIDSEKKE